MGLLYFFPGRNISNVEMIPADAGLADVLDGASISCWNDSLGPGECPAGSTMIRVAPDEGRLEYKPDLQHWLNCGAYWVGWSRQHKPGPGDLVRPETVDGYPVRLGDGNDWLIPKMPALPKCFSFRAGQPLMVQTDAAFSDLQDFASGMFAGKVPNYEQAFKTCGRLLRINYRLPEPMLCMEGLGLITSRNMMSVLNAMIDLPAIQAEVESQKKT